MKVIIAGGRDFCNKVLFLQSITEWKDKYGYPTEVVCGMAHGADTLGRLWAEFMDIHVKKFPADWNKHGKSAGPIRNLEMAKYADGCIVFWDGKSKGTANMIQNAKAHNLKLHVINY